jgi:hypothetical protein
MRKCLVRWRTPGTTVKAQKLEGEGLMCGGILGSTGHAKIGPVV